MSFPPVAQVPPEFQSMRDLREKSKIYFENGVVVTYPLVLPGRPRRESSKHEKDTILNGVILADSPRLCRKDGIYDLVCKLLNANRELRRKVVDKQCQKVNVAQVKVYDCFGVIAMDTPVLGKPVTFYYHPRINRHVSKAGYELDFEDLGRNISKAAYERIRRNTHAA